MAKKEVVDGHGVVLSQEDLQLLGSKIGKRTVELPDPTPMAPPVGFVRRQPLHLQIREMVQRELSQAAAASGLETAEEADDFDVDDDVDPGSPFEHDFEPPREAPSAQVEVERLEKLIATVRREREAPDRIRELQQELKALQEGKEWPPALGGRGGEAPKRTAKRSAQRDPEPSEEGDHV